MFRKTLYEPVVYIAKTFEGLNIRFSCKSASLLYRLDVLYGIFQSTKAKSMTQILYLLVKKGAIR